MDKKTKINEEITFEEASQKLEQIVKLLEDPSTSLDKSLELYAEGVELIKICNQKLDEAEQKITTLLNKGENNE